MLFIANLHIKSKYYAKKLNSTKRSGARAQKNKPHMPRLTLASDALIIASLN